MLDPRRSPFHGSRIKPLRHILVGLGAIASAPAVMYVVCRWHFLVGLVVGVIYGGAALTVGTAYLVGGASPLVARLAKRRRPRASSEIPNARLLPPGDRAR